MKYLTPGEGLLYYIMVFVALFTASFPMMVSGQMETIEVAGQMREVIIYAPEDVPANAPLVFDIHGYDMDAPQQRNMCRFDEVADKEGFIVVYPNSIDRSWNIGSDSDVNFILELIDTVDARHGVDRNRVYVCGFSQGGFFTFSLGCTHSDVFAAIAPVAGLMRGSCRPVRPVSMMHSIGSADDLFDPEDVERDIQTWVELNNCPSTPEIISPYPENNPNSLVTETYYGPCDNGTEVILHWVEGAGHQWPLQTRTWVNTSEEIWAFFSRHTLDEGETFTVNPTPSSSGPLTASYVSEVVYLRGDKEINEIQVVDTQGRIVLESTVKQRAFAFENHPSGVYFIRAPGEETSIPMIIAVP